MFDGNTSAEKRPIWRPKTRIINRLLHIAMLAGLGQWSFYGIFRCPFIVPYINCQNCPVITCHGRLFSLFWGFWAGWILLAVLFGRAFCGWLCPGGFTNRLLGSFAKLRLERETLLHRLLPWGKYFGLALTLWVLLEMNQPRVNIPIRVGEFFPAIAQTWNFAQPVWIVRTVFILAILALGIFLPAAWCRLSARPAARWNPQGASASFAFSKPGTATIVSCARKPAIWIPGLKKQIVPTAATAFIPARKSA